MENLPKTSNPEPRVLDARNKKADGFIDEFLYPAVAKGETVDNKGVLTWLRAYKEEHKGVGEDFDMGVVYGRTLERLRKYPATTSKSGEAMTEEFERCLQVLELLEQLDFKWIDRKLEKL